MANVCVHGERKYVTGTSAKGPWAAWMCPTPRGTADQCAPEWIKTEQPKASPGPSQATTEASTAMLELLERIAIALERISNKDLDSIPFGN